MSNPASGHLREKVVSSVIEPGVLPCIKVKEKTGFVAYAQAMYDGGARTVEVTMTTPSALAAIEEISAHFGGRMFVGAGTVLDAATARSVILHGGHFLVNPAVVPEVIEVANAYGVPVFSGAFTATECLQALKAGVDMVKIFPAKLGGPGYMTNLRMVYPEIKLVPSGGISLENAGDFIRCGAAAVSGARTFMNPEKINEEGVGWITAQVSRYLEAIRKARENMPPLP